MACEVGDEGSGSGSLKIKNRRDRIKLLCSFGGKILPRPSDGILKYVGGETRVIALSHDANFFELMKKVNAVVEGDMVLKYQLISEGLDALVSVRSDEDVKHMLDEYDRQEKQGMSPRLRTFLFSSKLIMIESSSNNNNNNQTLELEQRYIDAINGIVRSSSKQPIMMIGGSPRLSSSFGNNCSSPHLSNSFGNNCSSPLASYSPLTSFSSACSSPKSESPEHHYMVVQEANQILQASRFSLPLVMHKVHSSPSICGNLNLQQQYQNLNLAHRHHHHQYPQKHQSGHYQMTRSLSRNSHPQNHSRGTPTPPHMSPGGRSESGSVRSLMGQNQSHHNSTCTSPRHQHQRMINIAAVGGGRSYGYSDDSCSRVDRAESLPTSP